MDELMDDEASREDGLVVTVPLVNVNDVGIVVPTDDLAFLAAAGVFDEKAVGFVLNGGRNFRGRVAGKVDSPAE
jgi:hypothetical protein